MSLTVHRLQLLCGVRNEAWDPEGKLSLTFKAVELGEEAGEVLGAVKKLERERLGLRGSRIDPENLAEELADTVITACNLANAAGINLTLAIGNKFNATSRKVGLEVYI